MANTKITSANLDTLTTLTVDDITIDGFTIAAVDTSGLILDSGGDIVLDAAGGDIILKNAGSTNGNIVLGDATDPTVKITSGSTFTIDAAGDIILDADGGDVNFKDAGTEFFRVSITDPTAVTGAILHVPVNDSSLTITGIDGGNSVTAVTFSMADAGAATFNAGGRFNGNVGINVNAARELHVKSSGAGVAAFESTGAGLAIQGSSSTTSLAEIVGYKQSDASYHDINIRSKSSGAQLYVDTNGHVGIGTDSPAAGSSNTTTLQVAGATVVGFAAGSPFNTAGRKYTFESRYAGSNHLTMGYIADGSTHAQGFIASQNSLPLFIGVGTKDNIKLGNDRSTQLTGYVGFGNYSAAASGDVDTTVTKGARLRSMGGRGGQPNVLGWDHLDRSNSAYDHNSSITSSFVSSYNVNFGPLDTSGNNRWILGEGPNGGITWIWKGVNANPSNSGGQAGWDCGSIGIDSNYTYMLVNYVKRMTSTATGTYYFGTQNIYDQSGSARNNPYMTITATSNLPLGVWCADVHFICSHQYTDNASLLNQGLWRMDTGARLQNWAGQFSGVNLYRSYPSSTTTHGIGFRTYLYYGNANDGTTLHFGQPAIYKCDGTEPTMGEIRGGDKTLAYGVTGA
tara:strand:- start:12442 stop:14316 length:1875 start_codon:yes stop_codon:yes gene_type:complete